MKISSRNNFRILGLSRKETLTGNSDGRGAAFPPSQVPWGTEAAGFSGQTLLTKSVMKSEDSQSCQLFIELLLCSVPLESSPDSRDPSPHPGPCGTWEAHAGNVLLLHCPTIPFYFATALAEECLPLSQ